jgi:hypothetical protein
MAVLPPDSSPHKGKFSVLGGTEYRGWVLGEGVTEQGLPVYVLMGDDVQERGANKRYLLVGKVTVPNSTIGVLEYLSPPHHSSDYLGIWSQSEMDMAFNELARLIAPPVNLNEGLYSFRDIVEFTGHYGILAEVQFSNQNYSWSADEQTLSAPYTEMTIEPNSGYALQVEVDGLVQTIRERVVFGQFTMTLLNVQTPDGSVESGTGEDADDFTFTDSRLRRERELIETIESEHRAGQIYRIYYTEPDPDAGIGGEESWEVRIESLDSRWDGAAQVFSSLIEAHEWIAYAEADAALEERSEQRNIPLASAVGEWVKARLSDDPEFTLTQFGIWRNQNDSISPMVRDASESILDASQLSEGISTTQGKYGWQNAPESIRIRFSDLNDSDAIAEFAVWVAEFTEPLPIEDYQNLTFKQLWESQQALDSTDGISDEESPFKQLLLDEVGLGLSWVDEANILSINKSAKRVSIIPNTDYGIALRITPSEDAVFNHQGVDNYIENFNQDTGQMVVFLSPSNGVTVENGRLTIRHNRAKSSYPFVTHLLTNDSVHPKWESDGQSLFIPDTDISTGSNSYRVTLREGWTAQADVATENRNYFPDSDMSSLGDAFSALVELSRISRPMDEGQSLELDVDGSRSDFDSFTLEYTTQGTAQTLKVDENLNDETWVSLHSFNFARYRSNDPLTMEQAMARATYPYEWELGEGAFTLELIQIYDVRDSEAQAALEWGMTSPSDAPPLEDDDKDSTENRWSGLGNISGLLLGVGIVLVLWWAFTRTGAGETVKKVAKKAPKKKPKFSGRGKEINWGDYDV